MEKPTTKIAVPNKDPIQNWWRNKKLLRQEKVKRIQYHQTSFTTNVQFSSVTQSCPTLCDPWNAARQASLSITISQSSFKLTSIKSVMPSSHLILCHPLFFLLPIPPSIRVFSNESTLHMRWPKYWRINLPNGISRNTPKISEYYLHKHFYVKVYNSITHNG